MKLLFDYFPIILFFAAFKLYDIWVATAVAIAAAVVQNGVYWWRQRRFETMHLITLGVIVVFGGATLVFRDETFIKWKPTVVYWLMSAFFLGSEFIGAKNLPRRLMSGVFTLEDAGVWRRVNFAWVAFFVSLGGLNLFVVYNYDTETWVNFKLFGTLGLTFLFAFGQAYYLMRLTPEPEHAERE